MKRFLVLIFALIFSAHLFGKIIPVNVAKQVALNKYYELTGIEQTKALNFIQSPIIIYDQEKKPLYYVFNFSNGGFVIVAAEDRYYPIIGYSDKFTYKAENQPPNVKYWMNVYKKDIQLVRQNNLKAENANQWDRYAVDFKSFKPILDKNVVQLNTPLWDQGCGWNTYCPEDDGGDCGHVWTGCVATAMGIIMKYWNYPLRGEGSHSYYDYPYGTLSANFGETNYMWEQMDDVQPSDAAALLLFHAGVSVDMNYSPDGSGAYSWDAIEAFKDYFRYNNSAALYNKSDYSTTEWINMLKNQLDLNRPVYYSGRDDDNAGHAFVCDGYDDSNDYFHFNFGWSGYNNGFYSLTDVGGFHNGQQAGLNIYPDADYYPYATNGTDATAILDTNILDDFVININWNQVDNATRYVLYRDNDSIANLTTTSYIDDQGEPGDHHYSVRTYFADGSLALGNDAFVDATFNITFTIKDPDGNLLRNAEVTFNGQTNTASFGSATFMNVPFGWNYNYTITHSDYSTLTGTIDVIYKDANFKFYMGTPGNVDNYNSLIIYPNPVNQLLNIQGVNTNTTVELYNFAGQLLRTITIDHNTQIDLSDLPSGVYNIHLTNNQTSAEYKIIKR